MKRPTCSRCLESGWVCLYSSLKKKPGPGKGIRKRARNVQEDIASPSSESSAQSGEAVAPLLSQGQQVSFPDSDFAFIDAISILNPVPEEALGDFLPVASWPTPSLEQLCAMEPCLTFDQERELLESFFEQVHSSIPLFRRDEFIRQFEFGTVNRELLITVLALTAKILGRPSYWTEQGLNDCLSHLQARTACLLAFYGFHQHPGEKAWLQIGQLTRKAYRYGLRQLDNDNQSAMLACSPLVGDEVDKWRHVWWCIFCLDSYSNITTASPFIVHVESIRTSLLTGPGEEGRRKTQIFLPDETDTLWQIVVEITSHGKHLNFNLHVVTTLILREAATLYQLCWQNPLERLHRLLGALKNHLTAVRLALPPRYMKVTRDVLHDEPCSAYHARLICLLHLHKSEEQRLCLWHKTFEYCQDIVDVVKQWGSQHSTSVDPAVCFIIYTALVILHLHYTTLASSKPERQATLGTQKYILRLFLEQFAFSWNLPRFLISK
ncbi:putative fungal-specific transcription factor [Dactylonectria estremocensis]|uniref:Fungal-specific transcription factor n=1 Tax=Dactylonectria estremocensis TaxID=1079267 RepID=A0A9P9DF24_9HYPO|nr:putative fungal-specific transcription factor [Dactylonectria estremocensis]